MGMWGNGLDGDVEEALDDDDVRCMRKLLIDSDGVQSHMEVWGRLLTVVCVKEDICEDMKDALDGGVEESLDDIIEEVYDDSGLCRGHF